jgi:hypothetical protein
MLKFRQLLCDAVSMMIVDKRDGPDHRSDGTRRPLGDKAIANQVAKRFGPVGISKPGDEIIEALEEIGIQCNTDSTENAHGHSLEENRLSMGKFKVSTILRFVSRPGRSHDWSGRKIEFHRITWHAAS